MDLLFMRLGVQLDTGTGSLDRKALCERRAQLPVRSGKH